MFLVIGLGNPGIEYENSRHNIGFHVADELALRFSAKETTDKYTKSSYFIINNDIHLACAKPSTFMNNSGFSVKKLLHKYDIHNDRLIVVHDDLDLELGKIKVKYGGSSGGHLGVASISGSIGNDNYYRIRVGISRPPRRKDPAIFVLESFRKSEIDKKDIAVQMAADAILDIIRLGLDPTMNKYN